MQALPILSIVCFSIVLVLSANQDKIENLPGLPDKINFNQYAGYVTVDQTNQRKLFYWFVESQNDPKTDPLVLWLNGGPGCSSLGGMMTELGPFRPNSDGATLRLNPYSWNRVANVIFLESPAGVGFSKTNNANDYNVGDVRTANDSYIFLQTFLSEYPQFRDHKFWVTGESYGGHYVPELAKRILDGNKDAKEPKINLAGFMAGNPWTYMPIDNIGAVFDWWSHALISDSTYVGVTKTCNFSEIGPLTISKGNYFAADSSKKEHIESHPGDACDDFLNKAMTEMGNINIYDIYVDVCLQTRVRAIVQQLARSGSRLHQVMLDKIDPPYKPCEDEFTQTYLNRPDVQAAIHASIPYPWVDCSPRVNYYYSDVEKSVLPLYQEFASTNLRILVYSGDVDAIVPYPGTRQWIAELKRPIVETWRPWLVEKQVGGYVTVFKGLTFATVRNAGHMVPETQPERAFVMFSRFLAGQPM